MSQLVLAAAFLLVSHYGISSTPLRAWLIERLGEGAYRGLYSLIALGAVIWLVIAWRQAPYVDLWPPYAWAAWLALLLMPIALILLVAGVSAPNPTSVGTPGALDRPDAAQAILRITRHPVMWAIALWALLHLLANGDLASLILFGTFTVLALIGTLLIDAKYARRRGADWQRFANETSNLPFAAIAGGTQRLAFAEIGWPRVVVALALYVVLLALHPFLFGVLPL
ncbi:MAG: NnrU family protein [Geminicoccaceae bacterium]